MVTDKTRQALKLALEALETGKNHGVAIDVLRRALADSALNRMAENARELGLDYEPIVEKVEDSVGMGHKAWDMVNPEEIAKAFHEALAEPPCKTGSQCISKCQQCEQQSASDSVERGEPVAYNKTEINCFAQDLYDQKMREGEHGHYESMFHVIHQCIKKTSPQPSKPWVGLTPYEIQELHLKKSHWGNFACAIEAKLREKNT